MEYVGIILGLISIGLSLFNRTDAKANTKDIEEIKKVVQTKDKK